MDAHDLSVPFKKEKGTEFLGVHMKLPVFIKNIFGLSICFSSGDVLKLLKFSDAHEAFDADGTRLTLVRYKQNVKIFFGFIRVGAVIDCIEEWKCINCVSRFIEILKEYIGNTSSIQYEFYGSSGKLLKYLVSESINKYQASYYSEKMMQIKLPIIVSEQGDISLYDSIEYAESCLEAIDVHNSAYVCYDANGKKLILTTKKIKRRTNFGLSYVEIEVVVIEKGDDLDCSDKLIKLLTKYLGLKDISGDMSIDSLVSKASIKHDGVYCLVRGGSMEMPIIVTNNNESLKFDSLASAERFLDKVDVKNSQYKIVDGRGENIIIKSVNVLVVLYHIYYRRLKINYLSQENC
ncbi:MAG: hypothetical protein H7833_05740 [Magnetococcus sp. DMHC-1]|nr:hypothetical protein [Magnetococcales bacterium]